MLKLLVAHLNDVNMKNMRTLLIICNLQNSTYHVTGAKNAQGYYLTHPLIREIKQVEKGVLVKCVEEGFNLTVSVTKLICA